MFKIEVYGPGEVSPPELFDMLHNYVCILESEKNGMYNAHFPGVDGCYTCGEGYEETVSRAADVLTQMLTEIFNDTNGLPLSDVLSAIKKPQHMVLFKVCLNKNYS